MNSIINKMNYSENSLAVVISAYKTEYLSTAINSILSQSDQNFEFYIFSDGKNTEIDSIVKKAQLNRFIKYKSFENNLGQISLSKQWNRCIDLVCEEWIWLFSDDDIADINCVKAFYSGIEKYSKETDLVRFNVSVIEMDGKIKKSQKIDKVLESELDYIYSRLYSERLSFACEYIFRKSIWSTFGGFQNFPLGWYVDDAAWIQFANGKPILTLQQATVQWRESDINISDSAKYKDQKIKSSLLFLRWLKEYLNKSGRKETFNELLPLNKQLIWYYKNIYYLRKIDVLSIKLFIKFIKYSRESSCLGA